MYLLPREMHIKYISEMFLDWKMDGCYTSELRNESFSVLSADAQLYLKKEMGSWHLIGCAGFNLNQTPFVPCALFQSENQDKTLKTVSMKGT